MSARIDGAETPDPWAGPRDGLKLLRRVAMVTHCVPVLEPAIAAWTGYLGFSVVDAGMLGADHCAAWDTPASSGRRYVLLEPASGDESRIRLVEGGDRAGYGPPLSHGWLATELLARDPDALAGRFRNSPFRLLGGPADLFPRPRAPRAMQVQGPSGELLYFTRILPNGSRYGLKGARSDVDRTFIVTVGGPSTAAFHAFYGGVLGQRILDQMPFINGILAAGCGVAPGTIFPTSIARIPGRSFLLEMDELPPTVGARPRRPGHLPDGMAMVSFVVADLDTCPVAFRAPPRVLEGPGYQGRRVAVIEGPAREWLELIESAVARIPLPGDT